MKPQFLPPRGGSAESCETIVACLLYGGNTLRQCRRARGSADVVDSHNVHAKAQLFAIVCHFGSDRSASRS